MSERIWQRQTAATHSQRADACGADTMPIKAGRNSKVKKKLTDWAKTNARPLKMKGSIMRNYTEIVAAKLDGQLTTDVRAIRSMRLAGRPVALIGRSQAAELCPHLAAAPALLVIDQGAEYWAQEEACDSVAGKSGPRPTAGRGVAPATRSESATLAASEVTTRPRQRPGRRRFPYSVAGSVLRALGLFAQHVPLQRRAHLGAN